MDAEDAVNQTYFERVRFVHDRTVEADGPYSATWSPDEYCSDFNFPFRSFLARMASQIQASLILPDYEEYEDFVEGEFRLGDASIGIYIEHSLLFVTLTSESRGVLDAAVEALNALPYLTFPGYGVDPL